MAAETKNGPVVVIDGHIGRIGLVGCTEGLRLTRGGSQPAPLLIQARLNDGSTFCSTRLRKDPWSTKGGILVRNRRAAKLSRVLFIGGSGSEDSHQYLSSFPQMLSAVLPHAVNLEVLTLDLLRLGPNLAFIAPTVNSCDFPKLEAVNLTVPVTKGTFVFLKRHRHTLKQVVLTPISDPEQQSVFDNNETVEFPQLETLCTNTRISQTWLDTFSTPCLKCLRSTWTSFDHNTINDVIRTAQKQLGHTLLSLDLDVQQPGGIDAVNLRFLALHFPNLSRLEIRLITNEMPIENVDLLEHPLNSVYHCSPSFVYSNGKSITFLSQTPAQVPIMIPNTKPYRV